MSFLNEHRQLSLPLMEFWSVGMDGCTDGKSLSLPTHMNHLKGKYKVLCFKKKVFLISLYERMRYFCLSLINTDKLSSQAEKVTVSNFSRGKLALIFSKTVEVTGRGDAGLVKGKLFRAGD